MKNRDIYWRRYKIQETLFINQWCLSPMHSRHLGTSHSFPNCHQLFCHIFLNLIYGPKSLPLKSLSVILVWGEVRIRRLPNLGCRGAESPGWFDVSPKNSAWKVMHEQMHCHNEAVNHQLPLAMNHPNSFCRGMFKLNTKLDADSLLYSLSHFVETAT